MAHHNTNVFPNLALPWSWGVPGVAIPLPPSRNVIPPIAIPWDDIKFHPVGAYMLRRNLGVLFNEAERFNKSRRRFIAGDVTWIAAGTSTDGKHIPANDDFFPEFHDLYDEMPQGQADAYTSHAALAVLIPFSCRSVR